MWVEKPVASDVMASRDWVIGVASVITPGFGSLRSVSPDAAARRAAKNVPVLPVDIATPPGETPGWRISHRAIYRANPAITMISSESGALATRKAGATMPAKDPAGLPGSSFSRDH